MTLTRVGVLMLGLALAIGLIVSTPVRVDAASRSFTLIGAASDGWGTTVGNIQDPGPSLSVGLGDTITLTLNATDAPNPHTWFIDYNNDADPDADENLSAQFSGDTLFTHTFTVTRAGSFTYRCSVHPGTMKGPISIQGPPADNTLLIVGGVLVVVVIAAAAGAMIMRKRSKPPAQPPTQ